MPETTTMSDTDRTVTSAELNRKVPSPIAQARPKRDEGERVGQAQRIDEDLALGLEGGEDHPHHRQQHEQRIDGDEAVHGEAEDLEAEEFRHHARREY